MKDQSTLLLTAAVLFGAGAIVYIALFGKDTPAPMLFAALCFLFTAAGVITWRSL